MPNSNNRSFQSSQRPLFKFLKQKNIYILLQMCVNESCEGKDVVKCVMVWHQSNLTLMYNIVAIEEFNYTIIILFFT